jgi:hypothetical protein
MSAEKPDNERGPRPQEDRDSIWSVTRARRALYFGLFTLYAIAGLGFLIWYHVFERLTESWPETVLSITQGIGVNTVGAAGLALLTIELPRSIMVVGDYIEERWLNPLKERRRREAEQRQEQARAEAEERVAKIRAEGRAEGEAQNQAAWEAWNERRIEAEAGGGTFEEPPPGITATKDE